MSLLKKALSLTLIVTIFHFCMPGIPLAQEDTEYPPESWISPEQEISEEAPKEKKSKLVWILLGLLAVVGGVAAVAGGGSGGDDKTEDGEVDFTW